MSVQLQIGSGLLGLAIDTWRWWRSSDIWNVPGYDPNGGVGFVIIGQNNYTWARITNRGKSTAENVAVRFYVSELSLGVSRQSSALIGLSHTTILPDASREVLCVSPWTPSWISGGFATMVVEAFHPKDPLSQPNANQFNFGGKKAAMRSVVLARSIVNTSFSFSFLIPRVGNEASTDVNLEICEYETLDKTVLQTLGVDPGELGGELELDHVALTRQRCPSEDDLKESKIHLEFEFKNENHLGASVAGLIPKNANPGQAAVIDVVRKVRGEVKGGISFLLLVSNPGKEDLPGHNVVDEK